VVRLKTSAASAPSTDTFVIHFLLSVYGIVIPSDSMRHNEPRALSDVHLDVGIRQQRASGQPGVR
jgi:hypothetical protein